jgi:hypothetical protein
MSFLNVFSTRTAKPRSSFDDAYPAVSDPLRLSESQLSLLRTQTGLTTIGENELALALSRVSADADPMRVPGLVNSIIRQWREENPSDPNGAAQMKLLEGSKSLKDAVDKVEVAREAERQALREKQKLEALHREFRSVPNRFKQLEDKIANLEQSSQKIRDADYDAQIMQHLELQFNPRPGVMIAGSIGDLVVARETRDLKLQTIADLLEQCRTAIENLKADNHRLAKELDLKPHKL